MPVSVNIIKINNQFLFNSFETNYIAHSRVNSATDVWLLDHITHKDLVINRVITHAGSSCT